MLLRPGQTRAPPKQGSRLEGYVQQGFYVAIAFGGYQDIIEAAVDKQHREAVDDRPSANGPTGHGQVVGTGRLGPGRINASHEETRGFGCRFGEAGTGKVQTFGAKHEKKHRGFGAGKADIGLGGRAWDGAMAGVFLGAAKGVIEHPVTDGGKFAKQAGKITEMWRWRHVGDAGVAGNRAQGQRRQALGAQDFGGGAEESGRQVAMVIGTFHS